MGILTCKICECVIYDDDDKLIECGRCEKWECITCSKMSERQYDLLNDKSIGVRLHWLCTLECLINVPVSVFIFRKMPPYTGPIGHHTFI